MLLTPPNLPIWRRSFLRSDKAELYFQPSAITLITIFWMRHAPFGASKKYWFFFSSCAQQFCSALFYLWCCSRLFLQPHAYKRFHKMTYLILGILLWPGLVKCEHFVLLPVPPRHPPSWILIFSFIHECYILQQGQKNLGWDCEAMSLLQARDFLPAFGLIVSHCKRGPLRWICHEGWPHHSPWRGVWDPGH